MITTTATTIQVNAESVTLSANGTLIVRDTDGNAVYLIGVTAEQWVRGLDFEGLNKPQLPALV